MRDFFLISLCHLQMKPSWRFRRTSESSEEESSKATSTLQCSPPAEISGKALGRKELLWKLRLHKLPRAELSGQNTAVFCQQRKIRGSGRAQRLCGRIPGEIHLLKESINIMEFWVCFFFFFPPEREEIAAKIS